MGRPLINNLGVINNGIDLWVTRVEEMFVEEYRKLVWKVFLRILNQTPQYTGLAVVNWNIGVGSPDFSTHSYEGEVDTIPVPNSAFPEKVMVPRKRGDRRAIQAAARRNKPKLALITRRTRVYFSNGVSGDDDRGLTATPLYLEELQDPGYWAHKLRAVNKPYETAQESVLFVMEREKRLGRGTARKIGGDNFDEY